MLRRAINSVLGQSYENFELIIVSDGSIDNTDEVVKSYKDSRIKYLRHQKSRGASAARNTGIRASKGKYIAFLDDDDEWTLNKLNTQLPIIENSPPEIGLVYAWMEYVRYGKRVSIHAPRLRGDVLMEMLDKQAIGGCPTIIIKREVIDRVGYFDESLPRGNDGDFIRRVCRQYNVDYVPEILARIYIDHEDRISVNSKENLRNVIKAKKTRLRKFSDDFSQYPVLHTRVLMQIAKEYWQVRQPINAIQWFRKSLFQAPSLSVFFKEFFRILYKSLPGAFPLSAKRTLRAVIWRYQILGRWKREFFFRFRVDKSKTQIKGVIIVYMGGMPRTGSSLLKNYMGDFAGLKIMPFEPRGFYVNLDRALNNKGRILIDKSTHYIRNLKSIRASAGNSAAYCCILRDPRDQLVCLFEHDDHPELPRNYKFWRKWFNQYNNFFSFVHKNLDVKAFLIRYEDLVRFPLQAKQEFLEWLGFDVNKEKLNSEYKVTHIDEIQGNQVSSLHTVNDRSIGIHRLETDKLRVSILNVYKDIPQVKNFMSDLGYSPDGLRPLRVTPPKNLHIFNAHLHEN
jgi:glycosyltransferase involved in cell wall biosynthesis